MRQLLQNLSNGELTLAEMPMPQVQSGHVLVRTTVSLVSIGTEKMLLDFGRSNWMMKARKQPDKVRQVLQKVKTDGLVATVSAVLNKLDTPLPLGYSNVGVVEAVGSGVSHLAVGDRVVSNGAHAEYVMVPKNLCAKIPDNVSDDSAAFTVTGSIALQGIRLLKPQLGETVAVIGLGLIGLIAVQLLRANGCRVIGYDFDARKLELARKFGAETVALGSVENPSELAMQMTGQHGVDGVLITASTTSNEPLHLAADISRQRGRVVLVGVIGNEWSRADFYKKELSFQVSCSYGPGRYDPLYEDKGVDYPYGFVRWTQQRNFDAFLGLLSQGSLQLSDVMDRKVPFSEAADAYTAILADKSLIGVLFDYPQVISSKADHKVLLRSSIEPVKGLGIGFIGAGNFSKAVLLPHLKSLQKKMGLTFSAITSRTGISAYHVGKKFGFRTQYSRVDEFLADQESSVVFVTTHHQTHATFCLEAISAGKHVFVEKPLCLTLEELESIRLALQARPSVSLMVGFNRRFSPHIAQIKRVVSGCSGPVSISMMVNAGAIPLDHWTQIGDVGGGRIIGEGVHFIDLARSIVGEPILSIQTTPMGGAKNLDVVTMTVMFVNGSIATIHYWANGHRSFPKETLTVFAGGVILELDNFRKLVGYGSKLISSFSTRKQEKGHLEMLRAWLTFLSEKDKEPPVPLEEIFEVSKAAILAQQSAENGGVRELL